MVSTEIEQLAQSIIAGHRITRTEAEALTEIAPSELPALLAGAKRIREHFLGDRVRCCSIVAAKVGRCSEDCAFCSQSAHYQTHVEGLAVVNDDEVVNAAMDAAENGASSFGIVNSGYGPTGDEVEHWGNVAGRIKATGKIRACASLGCLDEQQAGRLADLGVERYNHNLQTSRRHFPNIIKTHDYDDRLQTLKNVKAAGMSLCSGALFGMGESWSDRIELAMELRELEPDVVPLNFLIAIDGTPLKGTDPLSVDTCLQIIAIYRFILPCQEIKIAGGRETNLGEYQHRIFEAGADSFLIGNYLTTCGRSADQDREMVASQGLELTTFQQDRDAAAASTAKVHTSA